MNNRRTVLGLLAAAALTLCLSLPGLCPRRRRGRSFSGPQSPGGLHQPRTGLHQEPRLREPRHPAAPAPPDRGRGLPYLRFRRVLVPYGGPPLEGIFRRPEKSFSNAFADLLLTTYLNKVDGYNGEQVAYTGEIANAAKTRVEVRTEITMKDGTRVPVAYRMMAKDNSWRVYDIIVENLSLVKNYRTQFQDILTSGTPDELIARVKAKAEEVRKQPVGK